MARAERQEQIIIKETALEVAVQKVEELVKGARGQAARVTTQNQADFKQIHAKKHLKSDEKQLKSDEKR